MGDHSRGVTRNYLAVEASLEEGYWDEVLREEDYFLNQDVPGEIPPRGEKGRQVGEVDVWALNYEDEVMLPIEVKTNRGDLSYAEDQLERIDDHFEDWTVYGQTYLEE